MSGDASASDAERRLALHYARASDRPAIDALFALDRRLGDILRTTSDPLVGQMRLTWWHDALVALDHGPAPAEPVLAAVASHLLPRGIAGAELAPLIEGWEALLEESSPSTHARRRGEALFALAGRIVDASQRDPLAIGGQGWALADLARHVRDPAAATAIADSARPLLAQAIATRWSRQARPLGALVHLSRADLAKPFDAPIAHGSPGRVARLAWHRLTGR